MSNRSKSIKAKCVTCGKHVTVRVCRSWADSDMPKCCGRFSTFWLCDGEVISDGGQFVPADDCR